MFSNSLFGLGKHTDEKGWGYSSTLSLRGSLPRHTLTSLQFQLQCLLTKLCIFTMCVCIHHCLVKILQWLLSASAYRMQYCALICPSIMPTDLESADTAHFAAEASESHESGAFTPERARGLTFCYYFRRRRFVLTYFGSRDCWGTEHQCKWNLLLPDCWISRISRHMMQWGKKNESVSYTSCSFMYTVIFLCALSKLIWTHHYSVFSVAACFLGKIIESATLHQFDFLTAARLVYQQNLT